MDSKTVGYECTNPQVSGRAGKLCLARVYSEALTPGKLEQLTCPVCGRSGGWQPLQEGEVPTGWVQVTDPKLPVDDVPD